MDGAQNPGMRAAGAETGPPVRYDRRSLTYSTSFENPWKRNVIRTMEWMTGKLAILRMIREFERRGPPEDSTFWAACLDVMRIDVTTPEAQLRNIPATGPVVVVANHPHGMVDGMVLGYVIARVRDDYRILTRNLLTGIDEVASRFLIPVPFPHDPEAQRKSVAMRATAMDHLKAGGLVTLFPSGVVAASQTVFGPAVEAEWNVFTAQLIRRSGATVVPVYFPGANSRWYQAANRVSATLRQGLLLHEIVHSSGKPQAPVIGAPIGPDDMARLKDDPRGFMEWLRAHTLALGAQQGAAKTATQ